MEKFSNLMRAQALTALSNIASSCDIGRITSYSPKGHMVIVQIHPATRDDPPLQTGWIPLGTPWVGNGWGLYSAPELGSLCVVTYQQGSRQQPIGATLLFDLKNVPLEVESGEFWIVHKSGSSLKFTNDGVVSIFGNEEIKISSPKINLTSDTGDGEINLQAKKVTINAEDKIDITSPIVNVGAEGSVFQTLLKSDSTSTINLKGS